MRIPDLMEVSILYNDNDDTFFDFTSKKFSKGIDPRKVSSPHAAKWRKTYLKDIDSLLVLYATIDKNDIYDQIMDLKI
jgi:hypothetical protein